MRDKGKLQVSTDDIGEDSKAKEVSPESIGSEETQAEAGKRGFILVSCSVTLDKTNNDEINIAFFVNQNQRADVVGIKGKLQGDHTISYVSILEAILSSTDSRGISSAIELITHLGRNVLSEEGLKEFFAIEKPSVHKTADRKLLVKIAEKVFGNKDSIASLLKKDTEISKLMEDLNIADLQVLDYMPQLLNSELKLAKVSALSNYLCELSSGFLKAIQAEELTSVYANNRIKKAAGSDEKIAARALTMLNKLCELHLLFASEKDVKEVEKKLDSFKKSLTKKSSGDSQYESVVRYGLNAWFKEGDGDKANKAARAKTDIFSQKLKASSSLEESMALLQGLLDEIITNQEKKLIGFMGNLLDYEYELKFDLVKNEKYEDIIKNFDETKHAFCAKEVALKENILIITRTDPSNLVKVLARFAIIMSAAFPHLKTYTDSRKLTEGTYQAWLGSEVLDKGWKNVQYINKDGDLISTSIDYLKKEINKLISFKKSGVELESSKAQCLML